MYQPPHFRETRRDVLHGLIRAHPLGLLVSNGPDGPVANPIPFLLDADRGAFGTLRLHMARANGQWRALAEDPDTPVLAVFRGSDAYVSPSWYASKAEHGKVVPTWNYAVVEARGRARVMDDPDWIARQIADLTRSHEQARAEPWQVGDAPERFIEAQIRGIVGVEIEIAALDGKWKVSQNRPVADRAGVASGLETEHGDAAMAGLVRDYGGITG